MLCCTKKVLHLLTNEFHQGCFYKIYDINVFALKLQRSRSQNLRRPHPSSSHGVTVILQGKSPLTLESAELQSRLKSAMKYELARCSQEAEWTSDCLHNLVYVVLSVSSCHYCLTCCLLWFAVCTRTRLLEEINEARVTERMFLTRVAARLEWRVLSSRALIRPGQAGHLCPEQTGGHRGRNGEQLPLQLDVYSL